MKTHELIRQSYPITLPEVEGNLRVGASWVANYDIPDVAGWSDLAAAPELVHARLTSRSHEGRCPSSASKYPLPKPGSREVRWITTLHPFDELYYRIVVGRMADAIDVALSPGVLSYRLANQSPGWQIQSVKDAQTTRRNRANVLLADERCAAIGVADIRNYYATLAHDTLASLLAKVGVPQHDQIVLGDFLGSLMIVGAAPGIPIGPEASGLLGNVGLVSVDRAVEQLVIDHIRYTDDSWLFLKSAKDWSDVRDIYTSSTAQLGLEPNDSKMAVFRADSSEAAQVIQNAHIAYATSGAGPYRTSQMATAEIRDQIDSGEPDWLIVKFNLGTLRSQGSPAGLPLIYDHSELLCEIPTAIGHYLWTLGSEREGRAQIDREWLVEQATAIPTRRSLAGQLQVCRAASRLRLGKEHGRSLEDFATSCELRRHPPLQAWAATAWGSSKSHRPGRAIEYAEHFGNFLVRRAFSLTVRPDSSAPAKHYCWRRKLASVDPDLKPTLARLG